MSAWDPTEHVAWGYLDRGRWIPTVDKRSAVTLVENDPDRRKLASRILGPVEECEASD